MGASLSPQALVDKPPVPPSTASRASPSTGGQATSATLDGVGMAARRSSRALVDEPPVPPEGEPGVPQHWWASHQCHPYDSVPFERSRRRALAVTSRLV